MGLPVYVWLGVAAAGLLLGIYLRRSGSGSSEPTSGMIPITLPGLDPGASLTDAIAGGGVGGSGWGTDPAITNDLLSGQAEQGQALTTLTTHVDGLIDSIGSLVYSVPSSGGSGASATGNAPAPTQSSPISSSTPAPKNVAPKSPTRYYTYAPGKAPKGRKADEVPSGLYGFTAGKGYYVK